MASIIAEKLKYVAESITRVEISEATGIPLSTLSYVLRDLRDLPSDYVKASNSLYAATSYRNLRDIGLSSVQANRFRGGALVTVKSVFDEMSRIVSQITAGALGKIMFDEDIIDIEEFVESHYQDMYNSVISNMQQSPKPYEYLREYY